MKTHTHSILSFLFLFQFGFCDYNTEELKEIYGDTDPCEHYILKYSMDEIKALDERDFKIYEMQFEKCATQLKLKYYNNYTLLNF